MNIVISQMKDLFDDDQKWSGTIIEFFFATFWSMAWYSNLQKNSVCRTIASKENLIGHTYIWKILRFLAIPISWNCLFNKGMPPMCSFFFNIIN